MLGWSPQQESNLYLTLRRGPFYPLNYKGTQPAIVSVANSAQGKLLAHKALVLGLGVDQVHRGLLSGLAS